MDASPTIDLVDPHIGHTAAKTKEGLTRARSGALFIDEADYLYRPRKARDHGQKSHAAGVPGASHHATAFRECPVDVQRAGPRLTSQVFAQGTATGDR